jgi:hypothetical protein
MLYQSFNSSTCAVCAVANVLNLYGMPCTREEARKLLIPSASKRNFFVNHTMLLSAVNYHLAQNSLRWKRFSTFSFIRMSRTLRTLFLRGAPALVTFHIRHSKRNSYGLHCAIAISVDEAGIHIIDPLGRRDGRLPNATITPKAVRRGWIVQGAPIIVTRNAVRVLEGLPQLPKTIGHR